MAGKASKISTETIEDVVNVFKKAVDNGHTIEDIAEKTQLPKKTINSILKEEKTGVNKALEWGGGVIKGLQGKFDRAMGRPSPSPKAYPGATQEIVTQVDGSMATGRGGQIVPVPKPAPEPPGPTALERLGEKAARGGEEPPKVQPGFAKEEIKPPGETGFQMPGQPGGPLATAERPGPLVRLGDKLTASEVVYDPVTKAPMSTETGVVPYGTTIQRPTASAAEVAEAASKAKSGPAGRGVSELTPESKGKLGEAARTEAERAADLGIPLDLSMKPSAKTVGKAALGAGALALGAGFSNEANAPQVVKDAKIDTTKDVAPLVNSAVQQQVIAPTQEEVLIQQAAELDKVAESLEAKLTKDYEKKQARLELMKLTETVMHGLVTAIGANALLNRGSPFAVDFSQGPRTDWNAEFDRLQKDYATQMGALTQKYKLESAEKRAAAAEAGRQARHKETMEFRKQQSAAKQAGQVTTAAAEAEKKKETAIASATGIIEKIAALDKEKDSQQLATARGQLYKQAKALLSKEELVQVEERASKLFNAEKSIWKEFFRSIGLVSQEPSKKEYGQMTDAFARALNEKINPAPSFAGEAAAPAAPAAQESLVDMVAPDGRKLKVPASKVQELEARGAKRS